MVRPARSSKRLIKTRKVQKVPSPTKLSYSSSSGSDSDMRFSICVPTRCRPNNIKRLAQSIYSTASVPNGIEIIYRVDSDDKESQDVISASTHHYKMIVGDRLKHLSDLWDECYPHATSNRIMMCADDVIFRTGKWDNTIVDKTPNAKEKLYFIYGNDLNQCRGLATLPILSRAWIENVGYFVPKGYTCDWCDTHLHDMANKLAGYGADVRVYFKDVIFEHMHPTIAKAQWDDTYHHRRSQGSSSGKYGALDGDRRKIMKKLMSMIESGKIQAGECYG